VKTRFHQNNTNACEEEFIEAKIKRVSNYQFILLGFMSYDVIGLHDVTMMYVCVFIDQVLVRSKCYQKSS